MASKKSVTPVGIQAPTGAYDKAFDLGVVYLYDANHPEWLYPVASAQVVAGSYKLSKTAFAELNGNAYKNDQPIPAGKYTLYATDTVDSGLIALKVIVSKYAGDVAGIDLVAEPSDVAPVVQTILGSKKNTDGTYTWGSSDSSSANKILIMNNAAVQVAFSTAMNRISIKDFIAINTADGTAVNGSWQVSPDWKTATFKPTTGTLAAGDYKITVHGKDKFPSDQVVKNVYNNPLTNTSEGYFTVDANSDTTAPSGTVELYQAGIPSIDTGSVDVSAAVRFSANELMDVSTLSLSATPSLGAKPTASYVGKDTNGSYVYEFTLGEPLKVNTAYTLTVSGGSDLAGNKMAALNYSFKTAPASTLSGITESADSATQNAQAQVKDVFGKWVRAMSDRNMAQVQSLMTGGYVYEYDASIEGIREEDLNADSRLTLNEFSAMLQSAFYGWELCGTTLVGEVTADIEVSGALAGMEFKLSATSTGTSQMCQQMSPQETMYAVLEQVNGAWYISRAAEGIDIRNKDLVLREVITPTSPAEGVTLTSNPATFEWQPMQGVTSYLLVVADDKGHGSMAVVVPSTTTAVAFADNTLNSTGLTNIADVSFLFDTGSGMFTPTPCVPTSTNVCTINSLDLLRAGATYKWEVMGLGSNTFESFKNGTYKNVFRDITALSPLRTYKNSGVYQELSWSLLSAAGTPVPYNDWYWAYDAGTTGTLTLKVKTPRSGTLNVYVSGTGFDSQAFAVNAGSTTSVTLDLYQGMNWVSMELDEGGVITLYDGFSVTTTGGIPPAIAISSVVDNSGVVYSGCGTSPCIDQWNYLVGTAANTVTISGLVDLNQAPGTSIIGVSNWNESGAYDYKEVSVSASGAFTVTMEVYGGDNWFNFYAYDIDWMYTGSSYLGINTTAGSVWTPPITVSLPTGVALMADYGGSQDWDASSDTDNQITLSGTLTAANTSYPAQYYISSDGYWESGNLAVSGTSFTLPVTLYHGWNWISIDDGSGHWYGVNIYTSAGVTPQRPVITSVAGQPFDINISEFVTVDASANGCTVTVSGTLGDSAGNTLLANWYGYDGVNYYYDLTNTLSASGGAFAVTLPVVGTGVDGYNYFDLYDSQYNYAGAVVYETSGCTYTPPINNITSVSVNNGDSVASFIADGYGGYDVALATGAATALTAAGANSKVGKTITGSLYSCGTYQTLDVLSASDGSWSLGQFTLYDGYNYIAIDDGYNSSYVSVTTSNGVVAPAPIDLVSSVPAPTLLNWSDCYGASYNVDMGGATTLTVNGVLNLTPGGQGSYDIGGTSDSFTADASGNFSISVQVVNGYNYLYIYDADWNSYYVEIYVTNGYTPPPALLINSPLHDATLPAGAFTVSGQIDSSQWSSVPTEYYAWTYDAATGGYVDYSTDTTMQATYGYLPITVDGSGNFSFSAEILDTTNYTELYVHAYDPVTGNNHGNVIYVNNVAAYADSYWKPGARPAAKSVAKSTVATERRLKRMAAVQAKARDIKRKLRR